MSGKLQIRFATRGRRWDEVTKIMQREYGRTFGTCPAGPETYIYITREGRIVACFGLDRAGKDGKFLIERIYMLKRSTYPLSVTSQNTFQFGRLVSLESGLGLVASHAVFRFAQRRGAQFGIVDHAPDMHDLTLRYGFSFRDLPYEGVFLEAVPPEDLAYFSRGIGRPYLVHIEESIAGTARHLTDEHLRMFEESNW